MGCKSGIVRWIAVLSSEIPLLIPVIGLLVGQLVETICKSGGVLVGVACIAVVWSGLQHHVTGLLVSIGFACGVVLCVDRTARIPEALVGQHQVVGRVEESPRFRRVGEVEFVLSVSDLLIRDGESLKRSSLVRSIAFLCRARDLPWRNSSGLQRGDVIAATIATREYSPRRNPFAYESTQRRRGLSGACRVHHVAKLSSDVSQTGLRRRLLEHRLVAVFGEREAVNVMLSMVFGFRDRVSDYTEREFRETGLSHLLVLSGYQVTLVWGVLFWVLTRAASLIRLDIPLRGAAALVAGIGCGVAIAWVGVETASLRALLASAVMSVGILLERRSSLWNVLVASVGLISIFWPGAFLEPSLQLSVAALVGLGLGASIRGARLLNRSVSASILASLATAAVSLLWFSSVSPVGVVLNATIVPLIGVLTTFTAIPALALFWSGIDVHGLLLSLVLPLFEWMLLGVAWCADRAVLLEKLPPTGARLLAIGSILPVVLVAWCRLRECATLLGLTERHTSGSGSSVAEYRLT